MTPGRWWRALPFSRQVFWLTLLLLSIGVFFVEGLGENILEPLLLPSFSEYGEEFETFLWCVGILLPSLFSGWFLSRYVEKKLRGLVKTGERLAGGDLTARIPVPGNPDDAFGKVAESFNVMAQKLEDLFTMERRLLADISHELRSPLTRMGMALALAERGADPAARRHLKTMENDVERMNELVALLLQQGRRSLHSTEQGRIDIGELLRSVASDAVFEGDDSGKSLDFRLEDGLLVQGAGVSLRTLFANVVANALRYTPAGKAVTIRARRENNDIRVEIRDHGPGVPDTMLEDIFHPFFRVDDSRDRETGGVGLGLALARQAAHLHGGSIAARNANPGLLVLISLPTARD